MVLRGKLKRLEESIGGTAANKDEEEARHRLAEEKRARMIAELQRAAPESVGNEPYGQEPDEEEHEAAIALRELVAERKAYWEERRGRS